MSRPLDVVAALTQVARDFSTLDLEASLSRLVQVARDASAGIDHVSVALGPAKDGLRTVAATDETAQRLDALQAELEQGPALHVLTRESELRVDGLPAQPRWPDFVARATALGLCSYVGVRVQVDEHSAGVLSMWSTADAGLGDDLLPLAGLFAAHAGLTLGHARRLDNLTAALESRTVIGQAMGMTMQRLDLDEDTAFSYLTRISATTETKLRDVAASLVQQHHEGLLTRRGGSQPEPPA